MQLEIRNVSKTYPNGVRALNDVSLTIPCGMYGLLGPNGAGKSTLMRTIATLQEPDSGSIQLGELNVLKEKDRVRETLGYLPQEFGVYPRETAERLLDHFATLEGITDKRQRRETVDALLQQTNLWNVRKEKLGTFSGGMRQRFDSRRWRRRGPSGSTSCPKRPSTGRWTCRSSPMASLASSTHRGSSRCTTTSYGSSRRQALE